MSGRPGSGNHKFMSIVIGTEEGIGSLMRHVGHGSVHMHDIHDGKDRDKIISKLNFDGKQCIAFCYRIEFDEMIKKISNTRQRRNVRKRRIFRIGHYVMWTLVQDQIKKFLQLHKCDTTDVVFQCDGDSVAFLKTAGLKRSHKGHAHSLSDMVVWANNRGTEPQGTVSMDLTDEIERLLKSRL